MDNGKESQRIIIDLGSGTVPWFVTSYVYLHQRFGFDARTALQVEATTLSKGGRYICFDKYEANNNHAQLELKELDRLGSGVPDDIVEFVVGDATKLPYDESFADVIILSNILSAPVPGRLYMGSVRPDAHDPELCTTEKDKMAIVGEAIRVLKPGGSLIIANDLTPCYAKAAMTHVGQLCEQGRIHLFREFGSYHETDDWIVWHQEFRLGPSRNGQAVQRTPWNEQQEKAMRSWRNNWAAEVMFMNA